MAMRASEVIGADVEEERMTWRKGCSIDGVSKVLISDTALAWLGQRPGIVPAFAALQIVSEARKRRHERIVLQALPLLSS